MKGNAMAKKLWSIFSNEEKCLVTGMTTNLEHHHIFGGRMGLRPVSEKYGYIAVLHASVHPNGSQLADKNWRELDHWLKRKCQEHFIEVAHNGTREDWYEIFGRYYDDRCDEKVWLNGKFEWDLTGENHGNV